jgi:2-oxo-4-hydroxy-4-carboxy--5-ureidoimidazoline (OHCU) decarboxylase
MIDRAVLGAIFEGAPGFLARLDAAGPFAAADDLFDTARRIAHSMPEADQVELVDAHPRLGAPPDMVSAMSYREQGYDRPAGTDLAADRAAGTDLAADRAAGTDLAAELERLNDAYEARFGFRYCVFVAGRSRAELLPGMAAALDADRDTELHRALDAVIDIAIDRHATTPRRATPRIAEARP